MTPAPLPDYSNGYSLLEKLRYHQMLENGIYGWSRNPANEIDSNQYVTLVECRNRIESL